MCNVSQWEVKLDNYILNCENLEKNNMATFKQVHDEPEITRIFLPSF